MHKIFTHGMNMLFILTLSFAVMTGCKDDNNSKPKKSSEKAITAFSFTDAANSALASDVAGTITGTTITATVPYGTTVTALVATFTVSDKATVTVGTTAQVSGATANNFTAAVTYTVTAEDGTTQDYIVTVSQAPASTDSSLSALTLSAGTLSPTFATGTTSYAVTYDYDTTSITVTPTVAVSSATVTVNGTAVTSGSASGAITLAIGTNTITIVCTAQNGTTASTYTITATRNLKLIGGTIQGSALSLTTAVTTIAGTAGASGTTDDTGTAARFNNPAGMTTDGTNVYICDRTNHTIRKMVIATGVVTTLAGLGGTSGTTDATGTAARFYNPNGITTDGANLYVADNSNHTIRKIVIATGVVTTLAGQAGTFGSTDGIGTAATLRQPFGITTDGTNLYVAEVGNDIIRKIVISTAAVTTLAGTAGSTGTTDDTGAAARFNNPNALVLDIDGANLYVTDSNNHTIRKIVVATGVVTTFAGQAGTSGTTDATGISAQFNGPSAITSDGTNLYVADSLNHTIRKIVIATGVVTTIAGQAGTSGSTDATGLLASFNTPYGITSNGTDLFVADFITHIIRKID